jgi:hypothetical protein
VNDNTKLALALTVPAIGLFAGAMMLRGPGSSSLSGARRKRGLNPDELMELYRLRKKMSQQRLKPSERQRFKELDAIVAEQERIDNVRAYNRDLRTRIRNRPFRLGDVTVHGTKGKPGFSISIEAEEIECFHNRWPAAGFEGLERVTATFDTNGDLVDLECNKAGGSCEKWDGSALVALTDDMQCAGESRMGIKDRCHSDEWLHCMRD